MAILPPLSSAACQWTRLTLLVPLVLMGCRSDTASPDTDTDSDTKLVELTVLDDYERAFGYSEGEMLQLPSYLRYDLHTGNLFIYDEGPKSILEINREQQVVNQYGRAGQGPGEIEGARNLFLTENHLYVHDPLRYFVYRYNHDGTAIATFAYNTTGTDINFGAPQQMPPMAFHTDIHNKIAVTTVGDILRPAHREGEHLYERLDWEGNHLSWIGDLPGGYRSQINDEAYRKALEAGEVPASDLHQAFPVNDPSDPGELFIVHSSIPMIARYDTSGQKLWERRIPNTPEVNSIVTNHFNYNREGDFSHRQDLQKYFFGISGPEGELYLVSFMKLAPTGLIPKPWVHRFSPEGTLTARYTFALDNEPFLLPFLAVDFEQNRFLVISLKESAIRAYPF